MKKKLLRIVTLAACSLVLLAIAPGCEPKQSQPGGTVQKQSQSVYDRVAKSGKLRAAYITYPPALMKDTKTGKMSGIFVEVLEQAAKNLGLTVEWAEEVGWGSQIEGLQNDRYDIVGSPVWANPTRGKLTTLSIPVYYSGIGVYVRSDESRFTAADYRQTINNESVKVVTVDGETADLVARTDFPKAQRVTLPQLSDISEMFLNVKTRKADVLFAEPFYGFEFLKNNPDSVKNVAAQQPIRLLGNCYMFKANEFQLKQALDVAIEDLLNSGFVDKVIDKYEPAKGIFYRVARPYRVD